MDHSETVFALFKYVEDQYPIACPDRKFIKIQSARRWAVYELSSRILDYPNESPADILIKFVGELVCMIHEMQFKKMPKSTIQPYFEAVGVLLNLEKYFN